ncbi:MAG: hypothetical protein K6G33_14750 [Ruminococcus sp.]|uniref:hypothetical protein n=1 Tax=Ruminococcus sp. TaxID=41978 RepID=UPI0025E3B4B2|nr:hypothetical protein [Ruminococcus sp.]MCR5601983.1 hypothetical protein [Ruminococcus sp.]
MKLTKIIASALSAAVLASAGVATCFNSLAANTSDTDWYVENSREGANYRIKMDDSCVYLSNSGLKWNSSQRRYVSAETNDAYIWINGSVKYNNVCYLYDIENNKLNSNSRMYKCKYSRNLRLKKGAVRVAYQYIYENYKSGCAQYGIPTNKGVCTAEFHYKTLSSGQKLHGQWSPDTYGTGYARLENQ